MNKIFLLLTILLFQSCQKENPVIPPDKPKDCFYPAGNRNFTYRVDTVAWFPSTLGGVWAFSDSDAYLMGDITQQDNGSLQGFLGLHWNGIEWSRDIHGTPAEIKSVANDVTGDDSYMVTVGNWSINPPKPGISEFNNMTKKWKGYQFETSGELRDVWTDGKGYYIAVGDNGMVYIKNGYNSEWNFIQAPTNYNFIYVEGTSPDNIYMGGYKSTPGVINNQIWEYAQDNWHKLYDDYDTSGTSIKIPNNENRVWDIGVNHCELTDSIYLYIIGWESYLFTAKNGEDMFNEINLSKLGLPLRVNERTALDISLFSPSDYWVFGTRFNFYHWNGIDYQKMIIPKLPDNDQQFGMQHEMIKTKTGKIFLPTEVRSQVYVVVQGQP